MQGQRSTIESFPENVDVELGSVSNNTGMSGRTSWYNVLNPVESRLSNYVASSGEDNCMNGIGHDVDRFNRWDTGESSRLNMQNQVSDDEMKPEHDWTSSYSAHVGSDPRLEERRLDATNTIFRGRNVVLQSSGSNYIPQNLNPNSGYTGNSSNGKQGMGACSSSDKVGTSSGSYDYIMDENNGASSSTLGTWGLSCKRKTIEGTAAGQSCAGGSSSNFPQAENGLWSTGAAHYNGSGSLSLSTSPWVSPGINPPEQMNPHNGIGMRGVASNVFPSFSVNGNEESSSRNFGGRGYPANQQESVPLTLSSTGRVRHPHFNPTHQSHRHVRFGDSLDSRTTVGAVNSTVSQNQSRVTHVSRNLHPIHWNGASSNLRVGSSSSSLTSRDRAAALLEDASLRINSRNHPEHPMFVPATETRNLAQDPTIWSIGSGNISTARRVPHNTRVHPSSSINPLPTRAWTPQNNRPTQNQQGSSEFSIWSLFPPVGPESGGHSSLYTSLPSGPSSSSQERTMSSGANGRGHTRRHPRPASLNERHGGDARGIPHSLQGLVVDIEGRQRLLSEIRQVLNAMRRDENLQAEDYIYVDPYIYHGIAEMHDRHRDMRLDVDNMSYEELLELGERIGDVSTGLSDETILKHMKHQAYDSVKTVRLQDYQPCCICRDDYADGDNLGILGCGHEFHTNCIKQWLMMKNLCPICKTKALST